MFFVYGQAKLFLPHSTSLKDKRQIIQSVINRTRKRFNVSICEVDYQELWQRSAIGWSAACASYSDADRIMSAIRDTFDNYEDRIEITEFEGEIMKI